MMAVLLWNFCRVSAFIALSRNRRLNMRVDSRSRDLRKLVMGVITGGVPVYDPNGNKLGVIRRPGLQVPVSPNKYAIVSLGGCLRMGEELRPVPTSKLRYDASREGYVCALTDLELREAPIFTHESNWRESRWAGRVRTYYAPKSAA
jgi:hypothetical protein